MEYIKKNILGKKGADIAKEYLISKGYKYIAENYRYEKKEIDLIFEYEHINTIIFVEVKTRRSLNYGTPEEAVNYAKQKNFKFAVNGFLRENYIYRNYEVRLDVITILFKGVDLEINHIENAFY